MGHWVYKQAGFIIIIKPDQRTGIKMRPGLTHNGCAEEFRGSKCGAHFRCVNNEHPYAVGATGRCVSAQAGAGGDDAASFPACWRYMKRRKREINSVFSVLIIRVRASSLSAPTPCNLSLQKENCLFLTL